MPSDVFGAILACAPTVGATIVVDALPVWLKLLENQGGAGTMAQKAFKSLAVTVSSFKITRKVAKLTDEARAVHPSRSKAVAEFLAHVRLTAAPSGLFGQCSLAHELCVGRAVGLLYATTVCTCE